MKISLSPGKYVVAVSGGVDSMALLDMARRVTNVELVVAHFDHGVRSDSIQDRRLVEDIAGTLGLTYVYKEGRLGPNASEDAARQARHAFLYQVCEDTGSRAILMAHHQDDVLETVIWNLMRGTNRRGVTSLKSTERIVRPLLGVTKREILSYALQHGLIWREDSTNQDTRYSRNYIRHRIIPRLSGQGRERLLEIVEHLRVLNNEIDHDLENLLSVHGSENMLDRKWFIQLPHAVAREVMAAWLRASGLNGYDRKTLERLVVAAKVCVPGKVVDIYGGSTLQIERSALALNGIDR
jgi:tRNA(Ile)-lysidine synthetase-like protein